MVPDCNNKESQTQKTKSRRERASFYIVLYELTNLSVSVSFVSAQSLFLSLSGFLHPKLLSIKVKRVVVIYDWELELLHCGLDHPQCSSGLHRWPSCLHCICSGLDLHFICFSLSSFEVSITSSFLWIAFPKSHFSVVWVFGGESFRCWNLEIRQKVKTFFLGVGVGGEKNSTSWRISNRQKQKEENNQRTS